MLALSDRVKLCRSTVVWGKGVGRGRAGRWEEGCPRTSTASHRTPAGLWDSSPNRVDKVSIGSKDREMKGGRRQRCREQGGREAGSKEAER
jgi:hypothetical protein